LRPLLFFLIYSGQDETGAALVGVTASDAVIVAVGRTVVGSTVVGATVVGATVVGATVVGATVVGATVVGAAVALADALAVAVADLEAVAVAVAFVVVVVFTAGVVGTVPDVDTVGVELTSGPTVAPVPVVGGVSSALRIGDSPVPVPDRFVDPPIALGLEPPLALAWATAGDSIGSAVGAGQLAALQAMNPPTELVWDALVPYQQRSVMAPSTPVPITRFRTECGR
jgi:hypothetical protein